MLNGQPLHAYSAEILARIGCAAEVFCFLDYDGTLARLAPTPDAARPLPGTAALLTRLVATPGTSVALVTGRTIADLRRFVAVAGLFYIGVHGVEIQLPDGAWYQRADVAAVRAALPRIRQQLAQDVGPRPGILYEDKGAALACHYRLAARADAARLRATAQATVVAYQRRGLPLVLASGHEVVELRPAGINKGDAVRALLADHAHAALPLYVGDDVTDEEAFARLPEQAITVRVGPRGQPTRARYRVATPEEVQQLLTAVVHRRRRPPATAGAPAVPGPVPGY